MNKANKGLILSRQFIIFGLIGGINTLIYLSIYYGLVYLKVHFIIANTLGFFASVFNAYYLNRRFVFNHKQAKPNSFIKSFVTYGSTFIISTFLLYAMINWMGISKQIAPLINLCFTIPCNFILHKFWVFL